MMDLTIRPIEASDLTSVVALVREFAEFDGLSEICEISEVRLAAAMFDEGAFLEGLIALDGDRPVGYALFFADFSSFRGQRGLYLDDIYVTAEYRGRGLGEQILRRIARKAVERGFERIDFLVSDDNSEAIKFYNKLGAQTNADGRHFKFSDDALNTLAS